ncbi:receptor-like protein EIX2 [Humulus lupulus]|uniref:receptor-like protein EIX2 n=1 Tax=Humulus lupulus TaxID=3486 RepID=UPI002B415A27|nr:receptor-like protein EIX2 [Humulus lupulus]
MNSVIPKCFYSFPNLAHLYLRGNNLQGTISSDVANLTSIVSFDLSDNALAGSIPKSMGKLCNLEAIDLSYNNYKGRVSMVFESLLSGCLVKKLKSLHLDGNLFDSFTGEISDEIGVFENLVDLSLKNNNFSGPIPMSICQNLRSIKSLDISRNNFSGSIPECLVSLKKLEFLRISYTQLSGPLPKSLGSLSKLKSLVISYNQLSGPLPISLGSLSNLEILDIASNNFEGDVSEVHFSNLTKLIEIHASENNLTMKVSSYWTPPFSLDSVELRNWNLGPHFPVWLKSQKSISEIDMSNTGISDVIPSWLWNCPSHNKYWCLSIDLSENQIYGEIPEFPNDGSYNLNLSYNKLTGSLPHIPVAIILDLSNNYLAGSISNFLCYRKTYAISLYLENNLLSGKIPNCWMYWPRLLTIDLDNNNLTGKIPSSIGSLHELRSLHIHNNSLIGEIPEPLKNCSALSVLDLSFNKLVGTIPRWIGSLPMLRFLVLRSNNLTDLIPVELCKLSSLQVLDASNNNLTGVIPKCLKNLTAMTSKSYQFQSMYYFVITANNQQSRENANLVIKGRENQYDSILYLLSALDLSDNKLSGEIPEELTSLQALQSLNLSGNYLSGSIPKKIGSMAKLESLDLSRNRLSGHIPSGQIPTSTQLQTMDASGFIGNKLCGPPLLIKCREDHLTLNRDASSEDGERKDDEYWFRLGIGMGFGVSFVGVIGEIPTSTQLQSMDASCYIRNQLCGLPLLKKCREDREITPKDASTEDEEEKYWFRLGIVVGFGVGFAGVIGPMLACGFWRRAYSWFFNEYMWYKIEDCFIRVRYKLQN